MIQIDEKQATVMLNIIADIREFGHLSKTAVLKAWKQAGYIKQNPLEEWEKYTTSIPHAFYDCLELYEKANKAIEYLKGKLCRTEQ